MKNLGVNEIREEFLKFFETKDHLRLKSFSLVPHNDNSLLLINSGILTFLAEELCVKPEEILDYELWVYCRENPQYAGLHKELILSPRLDNLTSVQALLTGIIDSERQEGINVADRKSVV